MGGSASRAETTTTTTSISDSYNTSYYRTNNLSDVGNIDVKFGPVEDTLPSMSTFLPIAVIGIVGIVAVMLFRR